MNFGDTIQLITDGYIGVERNKQTEPNVDKWGTGGKGHQMPGSSPSRIQGNPQDERRWRERHVGPALIGPSLLGRGRERERDQTRNVQQSLAVALFFTIAFIP